MKTVELTDKALEDASYSWQNFTPMCVSWRQIIRRNDEPPPYLYKEPARIVWHGSTIMEGTVRRCRPSFSGNSWAWQIDVHDILKPLEGTLCFNASGSLKGALYAAVEGGSGADAPRKVSIAGTLNRILKDARKHGLLGADVGIQVDVSPAAWVWNTALACDTYAGVLRKLLGARPGMVCWVDYSGSSPVIRVADGAVLPAVTLDRAADLLTAIDLDPHHDLVPPAVGVVLTAGNMARQSQVWPRGASLRQEGCVTVQLAMPGTTPETEDEPPSSESPIWSFLKPEILVLGDKLPTGPDDAAEWWQGKVPKLAEVPGARFGAVKKTVLKNKASDASNYSTAESAQVYELIKGDLSPACKLIKWCYVSLTQEVYITVPPRPGFELLFGKQKIVNGQKRWYSKLTWRGRTVNTPRRWYRADKSGTTGPEDGSSIPDKPDTGGTEQEWPDYTGVLRDYYEITRQLPWEGTLQSLRALSPAGLVGRQLSITGGRAEWVDMSTVVQGVNVDLAGNRTSINTGVPAHLSLQDMMDRSKSLQSGQDDLDQDDQQDNPVQTLQYDDDARKSPEAPTFGPEGEVVWTEAPDRPAGFGFQVVLDWDDDNTTVTGYRLRPGLLLLNGTTFCNAAPEPTEGDWYKGAVTSGEIWLNVRFSGKGKYQGSTVAYSQGQVNPLRLQPEEPDGEEFYYSFHLATITADHEVIQYALGSIQIPVHGGSNYPYGPA